MRFLIDATLRPALCDDNKCIPNGYLLLLNLRLNYACYTFYIST